MMTLVRGFAEVCCLPWGSSTLMALGVTMVEVIMKNISNKKMISVMEAMLKAGDILFLLFKLTTYEIEN
jgi:hypothetical protein